MPSPLKIILDLDSTVISSLRPWEPQPKGLIGHHMDEEYIVYERPGLQKFLDVLFDNFGVAVWTAASKDYALFIVENILLQGRRGRKLDFVLFDLHGELSQQFSHCPKDLRLVWDTFPEYTPENTIIIDDYDQVFGPQMENSYPIPPFEASNPDAVNDNILADLASKLMHRVKPGEDPNKHLMTSQAVERMIAGMIPPEEPSEEPVEVYE